MLACPTRCSAPSLCAPAAHHQHPCCHHPYPHPCHPCSQIAACFSFTGSLLLGRVSTSTIARGIANLSDYQREPEVGE